MTCIRVVSQAKFGQLGQGALCGAPLLALTLIHPSETSTELAQAGVFLAHFFLGNSKGPLFLGKSADSKIFGKLIQHVKRIIVVTSGASGLPKEQGLSKNVKRCECAAVPHNCLHHSHRQHAWGCSYRCNSHLPRDWRT